MLFGTNNVTNNKKENAKMKRMQGEFKTGTNTIELAEDIETVVC